MQSSRDGTRRARTIAVLVSVAACAGVFSACGGGDEGEKISGTGYSYELPDGWVDSKDRAGDVKVDSVAAVDSESTFASNITVMTDRAEPKSTLSDYLQLSQAEIRAAVKNPPSPTTKVTAPGEATATKIDGQRAMTFDYGGSVTGVTSETRRLITVHDGTVYYLTLIGSTNTAANDRKTLDTVIDSWTWE